MSLNVKVNKKNINVYKYGIHDTDLAQVGFKGLSLLEQSQLNIRQGLE